MGQILFYGTMLVNATSESVKYGAPGEIRTPDPLVRSQVLYPAELRAQFETVHAIHGVTISTLLNPGPTIRGAAFVALRMFTEHSVAPHPAELRAQSSRHT